MKIDPELPELLELKGMLNGDNKLSRAEALRRITEKYKEKPVDIKKLDDKEAGEYWPASDEFGEDTRSLPDYSSNEKKPEYEKILSKPAYKGSWVDSVQRKNDMKALDKVESQAVEEAAEDGKITPKEKRDINATVQAVDKTLDKDDDMTKTPFNDTKTTTEFTTEPTTELSQMTDEEAGALWPDEPDVVDGYEPENDASSTVSADDVMSSLIDENEKLKNEKADGLEDAGLEVGYEGRLQPSLQPRIPSGIGDTWLALMTGAQPAAMASSSSSVEMPPKSGLGYIGTRKYKV